MSDVGSVEEARLAAFSLLETRIAVDLAYDGIEPSLNSPSLWLQALFPILLSLPLLFAGKRLFRFTTGLGLGLGCILLTWAVLVNAEPSTGVSGWRGEGRQLGIWAISYGAGAAGGMLATGPWPCSWGLGLAALGADAGVALAFGILIMGRNLAIHSAAGQWALVGTLGVAGACATLGTKWIGATLASGVVGAFLLAVGVDLLINLDRGCSLGFRLLLDHNTLHAAGIFNYDPPLATRLLFPLSWFLAIVSALAQYLMYRDAPFRRPRYTHPLAIGIKRHPSEASAESHALEAAEYCPGAVTPPQDDPCYTPHPGSFSEHPYAASVSGASYDGYERRRLYHADEAAGGDAHRTGYGRRAYPQPPAEEKQPTPQPLGSVRSEVRPPYPAHRRLPSADDGSSAAGGAPQRWTRGSLDRLAPGVAAATDRTSAANPYSASHPSLSGPPPAHLRARPSGPPGPVAPPSAATDDGTQVSSQTRALDAYYGGERTPGRLAVGPGGYALYPGVAARTPPEPVPGSTDRSDRRDDDGPGGSPPAPAGVRPYSGPTETPTDATPHQTLQRLGGAFGGADAGEGDWTSPARTSQLQGTPHLVDDGAGGGLRMPGPHGQLFPPMPMPMPMSAPAPVPAQRRRRYTDDRGADGWEQTGTAAEPGAGYAAANGYRRTNEYAQRPGRTHTTD